MSVFLTGDLHGMGGSRRLAKPFFNAGGLTRDDYLIIVGDFGLVWKDLDRDGARLGIDWISRHPWTTLFIDGNHENHAALNSLPVEEWNGCRVHRLADNVIHIMRGEVFELEGIRYFAMGGAYSIDRHLRTPGLSWWPEEVPSEEARAHALETLASVDWNVDVVLTHCPSVRGLDFCLTRDQRAHIQEDEFMEWLQHEVDEKTTYKRWFFGHIHKDDPSKAPYTPLYYSVVQIEKDGEAGDDSPDSIVVKPREYKKPLVMPDPQFEIGYTYAEIADYMECSYQEAAEACRDALHGQTCGIHPQTGEHLIYASDVRQVLDLIALRYG